jgi:thermolysin
MSPMKKALGLVLCVFSVFSFLRSEYVGKVYFRAADGNRLKRIGERIEVPTALGLLRIRTSKEGPLFLTQAVPAGSQKSLTNIAGEIRKGNLLLKRVEIDPLAGMEHRRYTQYYNGLEVLGGQIIQHFKQGRLVNTNGEYYEALNVDTTPYVSSAIACELYKVHLAKPESTESKGGTKLIVFPIKDGEYRLAYQVSLDSGDTFSMNGIIDAQTGEVIKEYSNINSDELTIGLGIGIHGDQFKLPTTYDNNVYKLEDLKKARPVNQKTYDYRTWDGQAYYVASDIDNIWDEDGALVNVHAYLGWVYDYYYLVFGRNGIDDKNLDINEVVHQTGDTDNAEWNSSNLEMFFFDSGPLGLQTAAALDVIAHEYTHGVTQFTSDLQYYCDQNAQPGALNESFSDIMGTAVEFYWQNPGEGFEKSDWVIAEDAYSTYSPNNYLRSLADPNSASWEYQGIFYPYPCHLSQCVIFPDTQEGDWGGVHFNSTLYSHAYYLLSAGGTNKVSGLSVSGIGIEKATKIFYRAWTYYMTSTADYLFAANCLLQSAGDLYGANSNEYAQTIKAMEAIGWTIN